MVARRALPRFLATSKFLTSCYCCKQFRLVIVSIRQPHWLTDTQPDMLLILLYSLLRLHFLFLLVAPDGSSETISATMHCHTNLKPMGINERPDTLLRGLTEEEYLELPYYTIYVNFHFVNSDGYRFHFDPEGDRHFYAPEAALQLLWHCNGIWNDLHADQFGGAAKVSNSRIRLALYEEDKTTEHPGVYVHESRREIEYRDDVLEVILFDLPQAKAPGDTIWFIGGSTSGRSGGAVNIHNIGHTYADGRWEPWLFARVINHEIGHIHNLPHAFSCQNTCYDMNAYAQCTGNAADGDCGKCWGCNQTPCPWGIGNNLMGYNGHQSALTPCQWETMFNYALANDLPYAGFCELPPARPIVIDKDTEWSGNALLMHRDVQVTNGATLTIANEVRFGGGAQLEVEVGSVVEVKDGAHITQLCPDAEWGGFNTRGIFLGKPYDKLRRGDYRKSGIVILEPGSTVTATDTSFWGFTQNVYRP